MSKRNKFRTKQIHYKNAYPLGVTFDISAYPQLTEDDLIKLQSRVMWRFRKNIKSTRVVVINRCWWDENTDECGELIKRHMAFLVADGETRADIKDFFLQHLKNALNMEGDPILDMGTMLEYQYHQFKSHEREPCYKEYNDNTN